MGIRKSGDRGWLYIFLSAIFLCRAPLEARPQSSKGPPAKSQTASSMPSHSLADSQAKDEVSRKGYVIGAGDVLAINVWREPEMSQSVPVRPDGKISIPLVGDLQASGLTPTQLQSEVTQKLKAYISNPQVTVILTEVKSRRFSVVGAVLRPGSYDLPASFTVLDAIALAGGFSPFAKVKKIYVLRVLPDSSTQRFLFNYKQVLKGEHMKQNFELMSGDTVVVP